MKQKNKKPISELLQKKKLAEQPKLKVRTPSVSSSSASATDSYENSSDAEDFEDYKKDGYHPVQLSEQFHQGRFQVVQKLGWGHFSTVWLVADRQHNTYHALKIQKSKQSYQESALDELQLLRSLEAGQTSEKWTQLQQALEDDVAKARSAAEADQEATLEIEPYCVRMIDNFIHYGMHGKHYCTVLEVLGPSLLDLIIHFDSLKKRMSLWLVKQLTRQMLAGLVYMHEACGIIHTDLKPENIMLQVGSESLDQFVEQMKQYKKKPISMKYLEKLKKSQKGSKKQEKKKKQREKKRLIQKEEEADQSQLSQTQKQQPVHDKKYQNQTTQQSVQQWTDDKLKQKGQRILAEQELKPENADQPLAAVQLSTQVDETLQNTQTEGILIEEPVQGGVEALQPQGKSEMGLDSENKDFQQLSQQVHHHTKHVTREQEKKEKEKLKKMSSEQQQDSDSDFESESDSEQSGSSGTSSSSSESREVDPEVLYTLVPRWKEHIRLMLDRRLKTKIVDFGNACWTHKHFTDNIQTREYRSPEAILGIPYDTSTDIWSLGCIVYELITNDYLFKPKKGKGFKKNDDHLAQMQEMLGKMNKKFALSGTDSRNFFNKNGQLINIKHLHETCISKELIEAEGFSFQDAMEIEEFLKPMLQYEPSKRVTAREALKHPWLWSK